MPEPARVRWERRVGLAQWLQQVRQTPGLSEQALTFAEALVQARLEGVPAWDELRHVAVTTPLQLISRCKKARKELQAAGLWPPERALGAAASSRAGGERP